MCWSLVHWCAVVYWYFTHSPETNYSQCFCVEDLFVKFRADNCWGLFWQWALLDGKLTRECDDWFQPHPLFECIVLSVSACTVDAPKSLQTLYNLRRWRKQHLLQQTKFPICNNSPYFLVSVLNCLFALWIEWFYKEFTPTPALKSIYSCKYFTAIRQMMLSGKTQSESAHNALCEDFPPSLQP